MNLAHRNFERICFAILGAFLLLSTGLKAQEVSFSTSVTKNRVQVGENFQLIYTLNSMGNGFKGPDLSSFDVLSGPSQSTNVQFINGAMSQSMTIYYVLTPKQ